MQISSFSIYLIMQADTLSDALVFFSIVAPFIIGLLGYLFYDIDTLSVNGRARNYYKKALMIWIISCMLAVAIPSTKTLCAMHIIPKINNSEALDYLKQDFKEIYKLGIGKLIESVKGD